MARVKLGMDEEEFLATYPVEFSAFTEILQREREDAVDRAAFVVTAIYNVNRDPEKHPQPFTVNEVLGRKQEPGFDPRGAEFKAWVMAVERGEANPTEEDLKRAEQFKQQFQTTFKHQVGKVQLIKES